MPFPSLPLGFPCKLFWAEACLHTVNKALGTLLVVDKALLFTTEVLSSDFLHNRPNFHFGPVALKYKVNWWHCNVPSCMHRSTSAYPRVRLGVLRGIPSSAHMCKGSTKCRGCPLTNPLLAKRSKGLSSGCRKRKPIVTPPLSYVIDTSDCQSDCTNGNNPPFAQAVSLSLCWQSPIVYRAKHTFPYIQQ